MKLATFALLAMFVLSPAVSLFPEPAQKDVPAEVEAARRALQNANNELQHAGGQWGGPAAYRNIQARAPMHTSSVLPTAPVGTGRIL